MAGLTLEAAVVAYDIYSLRECNWAEASKYHDRESKTDVKYLKLVVMVLSLGEELLSSLYLSCKYGSPLDMKTLHTLPPVLKATFWFAYFAEVSPLLVFGLISVMIAVVSRELSLYNTCDGPQDDALNGFLMFSFVVLVIVGGLFCAGFISMNVALCCRGIWMRMQDCWDCCCRRGGDPRAIVRAQHADLRRDRIERSMATHIRVTTMFELSWQFMYLLWAYHAGAIGVGVVVTLSIVTVVGICLVAMGTQAFAKECELWIRRAHGEVEVGNTVADALE